VVLEQWPHPPERLIAARDRLRQLLKSLWGELQQISTGQGDKTQS